MHNNTTWQEVQGLFDVTNVKESFQNKCNSDLNFLLHFFVGGRQLVLFIKGDYLT